MATRITKKDQALIKLLVSDALSILSALGVPLDGLTVRRKEKMAKAFLAVAGMRPGKKWSEVESTQTGHRLVSRQIIRFMNDYLGEDIADSSYDDIRRKDLLLPVEAGAVLKSASNPNANTNDGTRPYAISTEVASQLRLFGTKDWDASLETFLAGKTTLAASLRRERNLARIPVRLHDRIQLHFSPGAHNELQKQIIEEFLPRFGRGAQVLYVGDTADKYLFIDEARLTELNFFRIAHDKLPDVIAYSAKNNWLYLIEAVHSANPITEIRRRTLEKLAKGCTADLVYVTAFPDRDTFRKHVKEIAWETEVWISNTPDHLIHFNGDKFLGPYHGSE